MARSAAVALVLVAVTATASAAPAKPVPGTVGLVARELPLAHACVPTFTQIKKVRAGDEPALVGFLTAPRPTSADPKKLAAWLRTTTDLMRKAMAVQEAALTSPKLTPKIRVEALARIAQISDHLIALFSAVTIPAAARRDPDAVKLFCGALSANTDAVAATATQARAQCAAEATRSQLAPGWWTDVCPLPPPP